MDGGALTGLVSIIARVVVVGVVVTDMLGDGVSSVGVAMASSRWLFIGAHSVVSAVGGGRLTGMLVVLSGMLLVDLQFMNNCRSSQFTKLLLLFN